MSGDIAEGANTGAVVYTAQLNDSCLDAGVSDEPACEKLRAQKEVHFQREIQVFMYEIGSVESSGQPTEESEESPSVAQPLCSAAQSPPHDPEALYAPSNMAFIPFKRIYELAGFDS